MKSTNIQMAIVIVVAAVISVVFGVPYVSSIMRVLITEIGWLPITGILVGFVGVLYGTKKIGTLFSHTKYRC